MRAISQGLEKRTFGRRLVPSGGSDNVYTPPELAKAIVDHFKPWGQILDPCRGKGAFLDCFHQYSAQIFSCEIDGGVDFFDFKPSWRLDWAISNPPFSKFRQFLIHSMEVAQNIVFLAPLNAWVTKARMRDLKEAGFGLKEALLVDTPKEFPSSGFQLAATHAQKGYTGPLYFRYLK